MRWFAAAVNRFIKQKIVAGENQLALNLQLIVEKLTTTLSKRVFGEL